MTYYTDNNQIKELMLETANVEVNTTVRSDFILARRPDWGGLILEMMKNKKVYIFWGIDWCRVLYRENLDDFRIIHCSNPSMVDDRSCLISENPIAHNVKDAILDLMEPTRFGQDIAKRLMSKSNDRGLKSMLNFQRGSYREICLNLEDVVSTLIDQRDEWKERYFLKGMEEDDIKLCCCCKENMRETFYALCDEEAALKWRPGKWGDCPARNSKHYSWESFAEEYSKDYIHDLKTEEYSDPESD